MGQSSFNCSEYLAFSSSNGRDSDRIPLIGFASNVDRGELEWMEKCMIENGLGTIKGKKEGQTP
jgi:hypothetical protein